MKTTITATVTYVLQDRTDPDDANRQQYRDPDKRFEVMDSDNFLEGFVASEEEAVELVRSVVEEALGLSGGIALGAVEVAKSG